MGRSTVILDACVFINLLASGEFQSVIASETLEFVICTKVQEESIFLKPADSLTTTREPIAVDEVIAENKLSVLSVETVAEEILFVNYAAQLDDGEAMSLALAETRGLILATDDRKARRLFESSIGVSDRLLSTPELLRAWANSQEVSRERLGSALHKIMTRANFFPGPKDPNFEWWKDSAS